MTKLKINMNLFRPALKIFHNLKRVNSKLTNI